MKKLPGAGARTLCAAFDRVCRTRCAGSVLFGRCMWDVNNRVTFFKRKAPSGSAGRAAGGVGRGMVGSPLTRKQVLVYDACAHE